MNLIKNKYKQNPNSQELPIDFLKEEMAKYKKEELLDTI